MSKKSLIIRNNKRIDLCNRLAIKRKTLISLLKTAENINSFLTIQEKIQRLPKDSSKTRIRNRCKLTGRARGVLRDFSLSRIIFRELISRKEIPGVYLHSW